MDDLNADQHLQLTLPTKIMPSLHSSDSHSVDLVVMTSVLHRARSRWRTASRRLLDDATAVRGGLG